MSRSRYLINPEVSASISLNAAKVQHRPVSKIPNAKWNLHLGLKYSSLLFYANNEPIVKYCISRFYHSLVQVCYWMSTITGLRSRPLSVGVNYGYCASLKKVFVPQRQRGLWLMSPMREWQSLLHWLQVWQVGMTPGMHAFRLALFSLAVVRIFSSLDFNCLRRTLCHLLQSASASSQLSVLMSRAFMSHLKTSLKRS